MKSAIPTSGMIVAGVLLLGATGVRAQDWPQWRGPNRDAKVTGFAAPKTWPKELTKKWKVTVGDGVGTPALVGDKLYVFSRENGNEVFRGLDAATGKELWQDKYAAEPATGAAGGFPGPRASPTVADGKVVTLGVRGVLSCYDAATGKRLWRKDDFKGFWPMFFTSSSPIIVNGLCIAQLGGAKRGGENNGGVVAYDLATGDEKWKWTGDAPAYASPVLLTVGGTQVIMAQTAKKLVGLDAAGGKLLWETTFAAGGGGGGGGGGRGRGGMGGRSYNASTPIVEGDTVIYSGGGQGAKAVKIAKQGAGLAGKELWSNKDDAVQFNTPVLKNGLIFGISSSDKLFCINAESGKTAWTTAFPGAGSASGGGGRGAGGGRGRGGMGGGYRPGYGSILDVGPVLLALNPKSELLVLEPSAKEFKLVAKYKVADGQTYAYPVVAGNRIFVKDTNSLTLWTIE